MISKKMELTEYDNELIRQFLSILEGTHTGIEKHSDFNWTGNNFHLLSDKGQYMQKVFRYYSRILDVQEDLRRIEIFLRRFPLKKFYEENDITYLDYSKYHMEVFFHKINTILDLLKLMVNEVFELGLSERKCTWDSLSKNSAVKNSPSLKVIEYFHKSFKHIIEARHLNTHRGYYDESESEDIRVPMMIYKNSEKFNMDIGEDLKRIMPKFIIEYRLKEFRKKRILYLKNGHDVVTQYINMFMHLTLPVAIATAAKK